MDAVEGIAVAARLEELGVVVRSAELRETASALERFAEHGNRALRRARARANRKRGRGVTR